MSTSCGGPSKKRRTLADADEDVRLYQSRLAEAVKKMIVLARENARMKVLLQKYLEKDDTLLSTSQMTMSSQLSQSQPTQSQSAVLPPLDSITESDDHVSSASSFVGDSAMDTFGGSNSQDYFTSSLSSPLHDEFVFDSQLSQFDDLANPSNLVEIMTYLDRHEALDHDRLFTMQNEVATLRKSTTVPRVGVGVLLYSAAYPACVLIGVRKASHGAGKVQLPGGHLEFGESWEECAIREVKEETALDIVDVTFAHLTNDYMPDDDKHYITIFMQATVQGNQVPQCMEPDKCEGWEWLPYETLKSPAYQARLFMPLHHLTQSLFVPPPCDKLDA
ncbi:hypothetical protein, variant 1 [Aphanomyces invadans]|uniref:Nudix hydrolase domain-containing protein n=1 Tax=Aphanomyces invadans TaxID=157072 RepID=A0A024TSP3_9STRA|nr:hypothetical protein, variant 1 [Aphanomyces invadans]ETV96651.1 hypothetical protein, variant 1 [Aphanomyces invadans]|eukprot:XP_008874915.1 hypothetical protein, variant 1 [Aphanomyces invadans]